MICTKRTLLRPRRCQIVLCIAFLSTLIAIATLLYNVLVFAKTVKVHTVSEHDLPPGYQTALKASLKTEPCCRAANWTPTPEEVKLEQIPRIIHQTYKTKDIPEGDWQTAHDLCLDLHKKAQKWRHILWTDESARKFIEHQYPDFLSTYDHYPYPIQRVDAMRYFILHHYGGIYIDLDIGCARSMESLLQFPAFFPKTVPSGVSNDLIGSRPGHPFMLELGKSLKRQGGRMRYGTKYMTVFFSTGPMFVNRVLAKYWQQKKRPAADRVLILPANFYSESFTAYFMHFPGSSWHGNDARGVMLVYTYGWIVVLAITSGFIGYRIKSYRVRQELRSSATERPHKDDYELAKLQEEAEGSAESV